MSKETEKLIKIILPDLLNYLEMIESGEIIEKRMEKNKVPVQNKEKEMTDALSNVLYGGLTVHDAYVAGFITRYLLVVLGCGGSEPDAASGGELSRSADDG